MSGKEMKGKIPVALALALLAGLLVTVVGAMITATMIHGNRMDETMASYGAMVIILLGGAASALAAAVKLPQMRFVMCLLGSFTYYLSLICCAAIGFDGVKSGVLSTMLMAGAGGIAVYLIGMKRSRKPKYKLPKLRP